MVLVLTSLISKKLGRLASAGLFIFSIHSCTLRPEKIAPKAESVPAQNVKPILTHLQKRDDGPTLKTGALFQDKTSDYGLDGLYAVTFNAVDLNFDGFSDLIILPTYYSRPKFYVWMPKLGKFMPWSHDPLPVDFKSSYLLIYDLNKDKIPDLVSGVLNQKSEVSQIPVKIYYGQVLNGNLQFNEDETFLKLPAEPASSVSIIDYDLDGWPDLFISNWFEHKNNVHIPVADRLLRNAKGKFEEVTSLLKDEAQKNPTQIYPPNARPTYGASTCDVDQNGYPDILTVSSSGYKNKLWMNLGEAQTGKRYFEDVGPVSNYASDPEGNLVPTGGGRTFFSACADYNQDGIIDIFLGELSHAYDNDSVDRSSILTGARETYPPYFIRTEYVSDATSESWSQGDRRGVWVDYNLDGREDLLVDNSGFPPDSRLVLFEQDETHAFINKAQELGLDIVNPTGTIILDLNKDGLPDILTSQNNMRNSVIPQRLYYFQNNGKYHDRRAYKFHLDGVKSNTHALGAMVMLYTQTPTKKIIQRRWVEFSQGGLPSQNEMGVHFGVDAGTKVVGVKVRWPYVETKGARLGQINEKLYSLVSVQSKKLTEITLCEDGKILFGKKSCHF